MINSDDLHRQYEEGARRETSLKNSIKKNNAKDIAILFVYLMENNLDFVRHEEPYRNNIKERVLKWLDIKNEDLVTNNIEEIRLRLSSDYSFFGKISSIFCFCCLSGGNDISMFQKFVYKNEYDNLVKYQK